MLKRSFPVLLIIIMMLVAVIPAATTAQGDPVTITWFVGLGAGGQPEQIEAQNAVVEAFNESHDDIELEIVIVDNTVAFDTLSTLIASGEAPDIVGPVGIKGANAYAGQWLDLQPIVDSTGYDLSRWEQPLVDFYRVEGEGLIGLPFGVFPSFIYFNRDLFDEAGLDYPPQAFGEPYADGEEWTIEKMAELGRLLTVDAEGNDATSEEFDAESIEQYGFVAQWAPDFRSGATLFGAGNLVDENGDAMVPENWVEAANWYYDGMWGDQPFIPNDPAVQSDMLAAGNAFSSGNVAMAFSHLWYTCCLGDAAESWDIAVVPSYNGETTAKFHADTFRILEATEHPEEAFEVLSYLVTDAAPQLLQVYGGMPTDAAAQEAFFATLDETYPQGVNWQVAIDSTQYPDIPSHEGFMPNFNKADERQTAFWTLLASSGDIDVAAELETLQADLQAIFDEVE